MSTETIFSGETTPPEAVVTPQVTLPTEVAEFVGEGKKYRTAEDALKAIPHAQGHIKTLEDEAKQLREELAKRKTAEELLEEFKVSGVMGGNRQDAPATATVDYEEIVAGILGKREAQSAAQKNISTVVNSFQEAYGDKTKAEEMYNKVAEESGLSVQALNQLAATSPEAVMRLAGITKKQEGAASKVQSTVNPQALGQTGAAPVSAKIGLVGSSTKELKQAVQNAREIVNKRYNP